MGYLPIFMDVRGRDCLVVGGGALAESRAEGLVDAEAIVTLIAPEITPRLAALAKAGTIHYHAREYTSADMRGRFMAWAATADAAIARAVASDARAMGVPVNAADRPELCDFITPAVIKRGLVQIAIGTGGASPALARRLREWLATLIGPEYGPLAEVLMQARQWLRNRVENQEERARRLLSLVDSDLIGALQRHDWGEAELLLEKHLGGGSNGLGLRFESDQASGSAVSTLATPTSPAPNSRQP